MPRLTTRRTVLRGSLAAGACALADSFGLAVAREMPASARIVLGFPAGSAADLACRLFAQRMQGSYARAVFVENKAGAAGRIGVATLLNSPADGTTLLLTPTSVLTLYPSIYKSLAYDPAVDLVPLGRMATTTFALCIGPYVPDSISTLVQFLDWCRQHPKEAAYGSPGAGSSPHFLGAMLAKQSAVPLVHVPYKGSSAAVNDLVAGQIPAAMVSPGNVKAYLASNRVRILALTSASRWPLLPAVPTMAESGFDQVTNSEAFAFFARHGTPPQVLDQAASSLRAIAREPDVIAKLAEQDLKVEGSTPEALAQMLRQDTARWKSVVQAVGFTPQD